ncbi:hypothetical protein BJY22_000732 [Kribbella shirazensis]|uniref:Uncharacterized protein n=1 Tax=Kribbella shirazensis TaxID=1105143 RepID=A0A7X5V5J3_9ACTN|nr:hypothetical protein [Kribbella shirazensis]
MPLSAGSWIHDGRSPGFQWSPPGVRQRATQTGKQSSGSARTQTTQRSSLVSNDVRTATKRRAPLRPQHLRRPSPIVIRNIHLTADDGQNAFQPSQIAVNYWYDATRGTEVGVTCHTGRGNRGRRLGHVLLTGPREVRVRDVTRNTTSALPHGQPHHPRSTRLHLPEVRRRSRGSSAMGGSGAPDRIDRHDDQGGGHRTEAGGARRDMGRNGSHQALLLIGLTIGDATVCTPSGTAGDGTEVRGHRCAGIETQPKQPPLTRQRTRARIGTAARRRSGGPSPGCWTSILAHDCAEMVARW